MFKPADLGQAFGWVQFFGCVGSMITVFVATSMSQQTIIGVTRFSIQYYFLQCLLL